MRNILRPPLSETELRAVFAAHPPVPLLPPRGDDVWAACATKPLVRQWLKVIQPRALADAAEPMPELTDDLYTDYDRTGNRTRFEAVYFERRRRLARAVFCALFAPDAEAWIPQLLRAWDEIFAETSWALPAHVLPASGRDPLNIDLFAAETANLMAELLTIFGHEAGTERADAIRVRLHDQIFVNYLERPGGKGSRWEWLETTNNWNAVCHQGILGAALALEKDADLLARLFSQAARPLRHFLSGFTPDGGCSEGPGYWGYGFQWFAVLNEQLEMRTRGALSLLEHDDLVREIARFGRRTLLAPNRVANFADGSAEALPNAALLAYLGDRLDDSANRELANLRYETLHREAPDLDQMRMDTFTMLRMVLRAPSAPIAKTAASFENVYLPDLAWWISHGEDRTGTRWAVAAKGGHNGEHHNHNDCGSFLLLLNGEALLDEIGASEYSRDFFSEKRYEFLATRTLGHSLPVINGFEQPEGGVFAARVLKADFGAEQDEFVVDLTACYPPEAGCTRALRTLRLEREPFALELIEEFEPEEGTIDCGLVTHADWQVEGNGIVLQSARQKLRIEAAEGRFLRGEEHVYAHKSAGQPTSIHRLVFSPQPDGGVARLRLRMRAI